MTESIIDNFEKNKTDDLDGIVGVSSVENTVIPYFYLICDNSKWMTGQVLSADAGSSPIASGLWIRNLRDY